MQKIQFDYFTGMEAEQYSFYRVPKVLFTEPCFKALSCEAKRKMRNLWKVFWKKKVLLSHHSMTAVDTERTIRLIFMMWNMMLT